MIPTRFKKAPMHLEADTYASPEREAGCGQRHQGTRGPPT